MDKERDEKREVKGCGTSRTVFWEGQANVRLKGRCIKGGIVGNRRQSQESLGRN